MSALDRFVSLFRRSAPAPSINQSPSSSAASQPLYRQTAVWPIFNFVLGIPDPDEVLRRTGKSRYNLRELLRDAEVSQAIDTRRDAVTSTPWRLEGGAARGVKFITTELEAVIERLIAGCWEATLYGYGVAEFVYARRGAQIGIGDVHFPPFEWFRPLPNGSLRFFPMTGEGGGEGIECDTRKFFLTARNPTYRNPYGDALLSPLYWPVTWRLQGWQLWLDFLETFGSPIVVGKVMNYELFVEAMVKQGVKRMVGWQPNGPGNEEEITTINANAAGEFEKMNTALNECIQRVVLGQTLTSSMSKSGGSFAAAKVHNEVREDKRRADVRMIVGTGQRVVNALWVLNGFPGDPPEFEMQDDVGLEKERADRDKVLVDVGVRFTPEYIAERYDLEPEDFTMTDPTPPPPAPGNAPDDQGDKTPALSALLSSARFTPEQQVIERGIDQVLGDLASVLPAEEIKAAIRLATSPHDLQERLLALLKDAKADEFKRIFERALFAADILGYAHAGASGGQQ